MRVPANRWVTRVAWAALGATMVLSVAPQATEGATPTVMTVPSDKAIGSEVRNAPASIVLPRDWKRARLYGDLALGKVHGLVVRYAKNQANETPIEGAVVALPQYGVVAYSDSNGEFSFAGGLAVEPPCNYVLVSARAPDFGRWILRKVRLRPTRVLGALDLYVELRRSDYDAVDPNPPWDPHGKVCHPS